MTILKNATLGVFLGVFLACYAVVGLGVLLVQLIHSAITHEAT